MTLDKYSNIMNNFRQETELSKFLIANPYSKQNNANYSGNLTDEFFNKHFLFRTKTFDNTLEYVTRQITNTSISKDNMFKIIGYAHSGKTTFLHALEKNIKNSCGTTTHFEIIEFENSNNARKEKSEEENFAINDKLRRQLSDLINSNHDFIKILSERYCELESTSKFNLFDMNIYSPDGFFDSFLKEKKFDCTKNELYINLKKMSTTELIVLYILILAFYSATNKKQIIIAFENLDNLFTNDITRLFDSFYNIKLEISSLINALNIFENTDDSYFNKFSFIFVMRNVTAYQIQPDHPNSLFNNEPIMLDEINTNSDSPYYAMELSPQSEIIQYRLKFIFKNKDIFKKCILEDAYKLQKLIEEDSIIAKHKTFFNLFDYDYFKTVKLFCDIIKYKNLDNCYDLINSINYYNNIPANEFQDKKSFIDNIKFGTRSYLFRLIFDIFRDKGFFATIGVDENRNLARSIISYCMNKRFDIGNSIPFINIYQDFSPFFTEKDIINCCVSMFDLRKSGQLWNHLISIENAGTNNEAELKNILHDCIINNNSDIKIQLSVAGLTFADKVSVHFEYFSSRYKDKSLPLFDKNNLKIINDKYQFENLIESVLVKVAQCIANCINNDSFIKDYQVLSWKEYKQKYCIRYGKNEAEFLTHPERIIHSHISYIDAYRTYLIKILVNDKKYNEAKDINSRILVLFEKYILEIKSERLGGKQNYFSKFSKEYANKITSAIADQKSFMLANDYFNMQSKIYSDDFSF